MVPFILISGKCKLACIDKKQMSVCFGRKEQEWQKCIRKFLGFMYDIFIIFIVVIVSWSKFIKLYLLNMCSLFYVGYTSLKLLKTKIQWKTAWQDLNLQIKGKTFSQRLSGDRFSCTWRTLKTTRYFFRKCLF